MRPWFIRSFEQEVVRRQLIIVNRQSNLFVRRVADGGYYVDGLRWERGVILLYFHEIICIIHIDSMIWAAGL